MEVQKNIEDQDSEMQEAIETIISVRPVSTSVDTEPVRLDLEPIIPKFYRMSRAGQTD